MLEHLNCFRVVFSTSACSLEHFLKSCHLVLQETVMGALSLFFLMTQTNFSFEDENKNQFKLIFFANTRGCFSSSIQGQKLQCISAKRQML